MVEGKTLCLEYLGLDYTVALDLPLYHFTFRDQYNWAVHNGLTRIWSSALGYDPKLHLRFRLEPLDLYVQHVNPLMNGVLQRTLKRLLPARHDGTSEEISELPRTVDMTPLRMTSIIQIHFEALSNRPGGLACSAASLMSSIKRE